MDENQIDVRMEKTALHIKEGKIWEALSKFQSKAEHPSKNGSYEYTTIDKSGKQHTTIRKYATLDECISVNRKLLGDCGLSLTQFPYDDGVRYGIISILAHKDGDYIMSAYSAKPERDSLQGAGSAFTYLRRYAYNAMLMLASEDDDDAQLTERKEKAPEKMGKTPEKKGKVPGSPEQMSYDQKEQQSLNKEAEELFAPQVLKSVVDKINKAQTEDELKEIWSSLSEDARPNYVEYLSTRKSILKAHAEDQKKGKGK